MNIKYNNRRSYLSAFALAIGSATLLPILLLGSVADTGIVAVLFTPTGGLPRAVRAVADAEGELVGLAGGPFLVVRSDRPGFAARLYAAGAWLVLPALASGCSRRTSGAVPPTIAPISTFPGTAGP